ncbi:hypothetical protein ACN6LA_001047 [Streptomyces sp. SAS_269]|uniref:hypothetical protein n=1 Tax=Streptomyces sp. SAS_269 TaxID=3412749 RepID=UPI00403CEDC2
MTGDGSYTRTRPSPGVEIAAGYVFAWAVRKTKLIGGRADGEVDRALEAGMHRLHTLFSGNLGQDTALERAREKAAEGREELSERTRRRLADSLGFREPTASSRSPARRRASP